MDDATQSAPTGGPPPTGSSAPPPGGPRPPPPGRRGGRRGGGGRRIFWRVQIVLVCLLAAAALATLAVDVGWQRERIVELLVDRAETGLGLEIEVGDVVGRASRGLVLHDVRLGPAPQPLLEIDTLEIRWHLLALFGSDERVVDSVRVEGLRLRARRTSDGRWETIDALLERLGSDATSDAPEPPGPAWRVRRLSLAKAVVRLVIEPVGEHEEDSAVPAAEERFRASLRATLGVEGSARQLRVDADGVAMPENLALGVRLEELAAPDVEGLGLSQAELTLDLEGAAIRSARLDVEAPWLTARAEARGSLERLDPLQIEIDARDLRPLAAWIQSERPTAGRLQASADLAGPLDALVGTLHVEARALSLGDVRAERLDLDLDLDQPIGQLLAAPTGLRAAGRLVATGVDPGGLDAGRLPAGRADLELEGRVEDGRLELERGVLDLAGLHLEAQGRVSRERLDGLSLEAHLADLAPWLRAASLDLPLAGAARARARLDGPLRAPHGEVELSSTRLVGAGTTLGRMELSLVREESQPARLRLDWGEADRRVARVRGTLDPRDGPHADLRFDLDLEPLASLLSASEAAAPSAPAAAGGSEKTAPGAESGSEAPDDARVDSPVAGRVEGRATIRSTRAGLRVALDASAEDARIDRFALGHVELVAGGLASRALEIERLLVDGELGRLAVAGPVPIELGADARWRLGEAPVDLLAPPEEQHSAPAAAVPAPRASGRLVLRAAGQGARLDELALRELSLPVGFVQVVQPEAPRLGGRVEGSLAWQRARVRDWTRGELLWSEAAIAPLSSARVAMDWDSTVDAAEARLEVSLADRKPLALDARLARRPESEGAWPILAPDRLAFDARLQDFDLDALAGLAPSWMRRVGGRLSGRVQVEPDAGGPRAQGRLELVGGGVTVPLLRRRFAPVTGEVVLDGRIVTIDGLRIGEPGADARLDLRIDLAEPLDPGIEGELRLDRLPASRSPALQMDALGEIAISGRLRQPVLRGRLQVADTRISVPDAGDPILKEIRIRTSGREGTIREAEDRTDLLTPADIDLTLEIPESTRILGRGANLFVEGEARLVKPPGERAAVRGEARVVNGTYTFQGRRFVVRRGRVLFPGDREPDPVLDIEARHPVADIVAIIEVTGRLSSPIIRLDSEPSRSEQDVLAYLLFGRPASEIGAAQNSRFDAAAARLVAGVAERELRDVLGDAMPVDSIEIGADAEGNTSELGFGKYIGPNLFFRYVHVLGDEPADRVGVEYRINDQVSVGSSVSTTGDAGVDLILRHDF